MIIVFESVDADDDSPSLYFKLLWREREGERERKRENKPLTALLIQLNSLNNIDLKNNTINGLL